MRAVPIQQALIQGLSSQLAHSWQRKEPHLSVGFFLCLLLSVNSVLSAGASACPATIVCQVFSGVTV